MKLKPYAKAIVGAAVAGLTALGAALTDNEVTTAEWVGVAAATVVALGAVWAVPNKPTPPEPKFYVDRSLSEWKRVGQAE